MGDSGMIRPTGAGLTRRDLLRFGAAATVAALVPTTAAAAPPPGKKPGGSPPPTTIVDPYTGSIPLFFPLLGGYVQPVVDNWHDPRDGNYGYAWSHQNSPARRAHDGIDIFPLDRNTLPPVYAPFAARVAAVNIADGIGYTQNDDIAPRGEATPSTRTSMGAIFGSIASMRGAVGSSCSTAT